MDLIPAPTWRDIVDILFLTLVAYQLYVWFRESRALRVIIGLVALGLSNFMASTSHSAADTVPGRNSPGTGKGQSDEVSAFPPTCLSKNSCERINPDAV